MKFGEDLFNNELRPAPSVAAISRSVRSSITAHSANDRFAPQAAGHHFGPGIQGFAHVDCATEVSIQNRQRSGFRDAAPV